MFSRMISFSPRGSGDSVPLGSWCTVRMLLLLLLVPAAAYPAEPLAALELSASLNSPQPVGSVIRWTASAAGNAYFRFRVRPPGGDYRTIRDFGEGEWIEWTASEADGPIEMEVTRLDLRTGEVTTASREFTFASRVVDGRATISPTGHPLVWLYSAPPCQPGESMAIEFGTSMRNSQTTPFRPCQPGVSMNFYLAGLRPSTTYSARALLVSTKELLRYSTALTFQSGELPADIVQHRVIRPGIRSTDQTMVLEAPIFPNRPTGVDLEGNTIWYYPGAVSVLTRPGRGGTFWGLTQGPGGPAMQKIREFDLAGITRRETNAAWVNAQLKALGRREICGFHHEVRELPDGKILALAGVEQILTDVQGPGPVDVLGDMIIVFDQNLQVLWVWDGFDHLDPSKPAILNEKCSQGSCPPLYLAAEGNDWTHANSVQLTADGNLLISFRHLDWVVKIDYQNGTGPGNILWRLGQGGDFQLAGGDNGLWFSHQHDAQLGPDGTTLSLYDNGNTRRQANSTVTSRGQVLEIDEARRTARLLVNADLGVYSFALGSAQPLRNGGYHFNAGWQLPGNTARSIETDAGGRIGYTLESAVPQYRTFRLRSLYTED